MISLTSKVDHRSLKMSLDNNHVNVNNDRKYSSTPSSVRKLSDQSSLPTSRHSSLRHQHQQSKPRELKVEYSAVSQKAVVKESGGGNQVIYVYCSPRLKHTLIFIFRFLLLLYCVAIPIFVYLLHHKSNDNIMKLNKFEEEFEKHLATVATNNGKSTIKTNQVSDSRQKRDLSNDLPTKEKAMKKFEEGYKRPGKNDNEFAKTVTAFNETMRKYKKRLADLDRAEKWLISFYSEYTKTNSSTTCNCPNENLMKKQSYTKTCDCGDIMKGPVGPSGKQGQQGDSGKIIEIPGKLGPKGKVGLPGGRGEIGERGVNGIPGTDATCQVKVTKRNLSTTYITWGRKNCREHNDVKLIYSGYMSGAVSSERSDRSGGANYLCLPEQPKYFHSSHRQDKLSAQIDGVKYGHSYFQTGIKPIHCTLCQAMGKIDNIMFPASVKCPAGWTLEYTGNVVTQTKFGRTEYVCLANSENLNSGSDRRIRTFHSLDKVQHRCGVQPCRENEYKQGGDISCVVCTI